jgi:hypothetical protein
MKAIRLTLIVVIVLASALVLPAEAQIQYNQINVSIPVGGSYNLDVNGDGVIDFTIQSKLLQGYCQNGDEYSWTLSVTPASGNGVESADIDSDYAAALPYGVTVNSTQSFYPSYAVMAELYWGSCGTGALGEWLNQPTRYLGLQFKAQDGTVYYGWAKLSAVAYIDQDEHLHASTLLTGFAYETTAGEGILTGSTKNNVR